MNEVITAKRFISKIRQLPSDVILDKFYSVSFSESKRKISLFVHRAKYLVRDTERLYITNFEVYDNCMPIFKRTFLD